MKEERKREIEDLLNKEDSLEAVQEVVKRFNGGISVEGEALDFVRDNYPELDEYEIVAIAILTR